jgi:general secretion pathway protein E
MGVEPYLLSSSLIGIISQRLVRLLCDNCKTPYQADKKDCETLGVDDNSSPTLYHPKGCPQCSNLGYVGRNGIYEFVEVDDHCRNLIHNDASEIEIEHYVHKATPSLRQDGARLVLEGKTSLEEIVRVTREDAKA